MIVLHYLFAIGIMADIIDAKFPSTEKREENQKDKADSIWTVVIVAIIYVVVVGWILYETISTFKIDIRETVDVFCVCILFIFFNVIIITLKCQEYTKKISDNKRYFRSVLRCQENTMKKIIKCIYQENNDADELYCKPYFHDHVVDEKIRVILNGIKEKNLLPEQDNKSL